MERTNLAIESQTGRRRRSGVRRQNRRNRRGLRNRRTLRIRRRYVVGGIRVERVVELAESSESDDIGVHGDGISAIGGKIAE